MSRGPLAAISALLSVFALTSGVYAGQLGADVNADVDAFGHSQMDVGSLRAFAQKNTVYPLPMFNLPTLDHARYWDAMVQQYQSAQIDFVAVWLKGNNQPATFANLVTALDKRGLSRRIKVMPFDDNAASWTAMWNYDHGGGYGYKAPFDVGDPKNWAYVWDKNLKVFFQNVPDANRYKINGRPVYAIWSGAPAFLSRLNGNGSKLLDYLRQQCRATFGFNPYIMVPEDWVKNDPSSDSPTVVDAVYPWFTPVPGPAYAAWKTHTWNGVTTGVCVPQFHISNKADPNAPSWIVDPRHGKTLSEGLRNTTGGGCTLTFIEGFDDYWENATLWRTRNTDERGQPLGYAQTGYDYPNQRINLVRRYSNDPFPVTLREEADGCDSFSGAAASGGPRRYRNGPIATEDTSDTGGGDDVCDAQAGETLQWRDVPLEGTAHLKVRAATASKGRRMHFVIDGVRYPSVNIPNTGGGRTWATVDMGVYHFPHDSDHDVSLVWDTGDVNIHWWQVQTAVIPDGLYKIVAIRDGSVLTRRVGGDAAAFETAPDTGGGGQRWHLRPLGGGRYSVHPVNAARRQMWTITPEPNGLCAISMTAAGSGGGHAVWSLVPVH